jgi:hypothetical protein
VTTFLEVFKMDDIKKEILAVIEKCDVRIEEVTRKICLARSGRGHIKNPVHRETINECIAILVSYRKRLENAREELEKSALCIDGLVNKR